EGAVMKIRLAATRLGLRDSHTRIPFRYGSACMTQCPQAVLEATVVGQNGVWRGYSGDCLPPLWFDKSPDKSFEQQIEDMLGAIAMAERLFADVFRAPQDFFAGWLQAYGLAHDEGRSRGMTSLLISF